MRGGRTGVHMNPFIILLAFIILLHSLIQFLTVQRDACFNGNGNAIKTDWEVGNGIDIGLLKFRRDSLVLRTENEIKTKFL